MSVQPYWKGHDIPKDREGELLNLEVLGEKPCVTHPFWLVHLPLSHPTTTLKGLLISWGSYCWGVECGRTVSPFPHAHSTSNLTLTMAGKPLPHHSRQILHDSICSTIAWDILPLSKYCSSRAEEFHFLTHGLGFSIMVPHVERKRCQFGN